MKIKERALSGSLSPEETKRERDNRVLAREAAAEGIVLLKNEDILPLKKGTKIALYGGGARYTIKGGTGSGSVNNRSNVSIDQGLRNAGFQITTDEWLDDFDRRYETAYQEWVQKIYDLAGVPGDFDRLYRAHASNPMAMPEGMEISETTRTEADVAIFVVSRISGEGADRKEVRGDYYLSDEEEKTLSSITSVYEKTIVVLNVGGVMDTSFADQDGVKGLVLLSQAGMEGGNALADILSGAVNPSAKLTDSWAYAYSDYPCSETFSHNNGNIIEEKYAEGIYVGYRYFDTFGLPVRYPFGFGLSYTSFDIRVLETIPHETCLETRIQVTNTGEVAGKEVVQIYASCPNGRIRKEARRLVCFGKTDLLEAGEKQILTLTFDYSLLESYHTATASYYLEQGRYYLMAGNSSASTRLYSVLQLSHTVQTEEMTNICPLLDALAEMKPEEAIRDTYRHDLKAQAEEKQLPVFSLDDKKLTHKSVASDLEIHSEIDALAKELTARLTLEQKAALVCGRPKQGDAEFIGNAAVKVPGAAGETTPLLEAEYGIPAIVLADGPAGVRVFQSYEENAEDGSLYILSGYEMLENRLFGKTFPHEGSILHYQFLSAIPIGTMLAQSFNLDLLKEVGEMIGKEMEEYGITLWLAPGMNIHRNPLCGRNFEYYSEDPLVSGMIAAAITAGVQTVPGVGTTIKHYACNNQEENRRGVSSIVSERALREIYLKGFEIAVKASRPMAIMTSYNKVNGVHTANSYDLCTVAARKEWGFTGIIMTDWTTTNVNGGSSAAKCIECGNDLVMPGTVSDMKEIIGAVRKEDALSLDQSLLDQCAERMLRIILASNAFEGAESYLCGKEICAPMRQG